MLGSAMEPGVSALGGVPAACGNAAPMQTLSWMNPADFNRSTVGVPEVERLLYEPAFDAPIFVVGCGHSGTTELITLLNRHPLITAYLDGPGMEFAVQPNSFASPWPSWLPVSSRHDDRTFRDLARRKHASHWAVKSPSNICRLGYILKSLPRSRVVMMVRDGRDTMLSLAERFPREELTGPLVLGRWINDNTAGLLFADDPRVLLVRLEDLSARPRRELPRILRHVGAPVTWQQLATFDGPVDLKTRTMARQRAAAEETDGGTARNGDAVESKAGQDLEEQQFKSPIETHAVTRDLLRHLLTPKSSARQNGENATAVVATSSTSPSSVAPGPPRNKRMRPDGRKNHDELRRFQVTQPLRPVLSKWPDKMSNDQKAIFKANSQAMRLLVQLGYANGTDW